MINTLRTFGFLFLLAGVLGLGWQIYVLVLNPDPTFIYVTGKVTNKYIGEKCYGLVGKNNCIDAEYVDVTYQLSGGQTIADKVEATCINWETIQPGGMVYVAYSPRNIRSRKICDHEIEDPYATRPFLYIALFAFSIFAGIGCFNAAKKEQADRQNRIESRKRVKSFKMQQAEPTEPETPAESADT